MLMSLLYHFHLQPLENFSCLSLVEMRSRSCIQSPYKLRVPSSVDSIPFSNHHSAYHPWPIKKLSLIWMAFSSLVIRQIALSKIRTSEFLEQASIRAQATQLPPLVTQCLPPNFAEICVSGVGGGYSLITEILDLMRVGNAQTSGLLCFFHVRKERTKYPDTFMWH